MICIRKEYLHTGDRKMCPPLQNVLARQCPALETQTDGRKDYKQPHKNIINSQYYQQDLSKEKIGI